MSRRSLYYLYKSDIHTHLRSTGDKQPSITMDIKSRILALNDERQQEGLFWFLERSGKELTLSWPIKTTSGVFLATQAAGIHKPDFSDYVLSIRSSTGKGATELYSDKEPVFENDGTWTYLYRHEIRGDADPTTIWRNKALLKNLQDAVPVAVIQQQDVGRYKILGLAYVTDYNPRTGYFFLTGTSDSNLPLGLDHGAISENIDVESDTRMYKETLLAIRQGQAKFRSDLLTAYGEKCAATDYDVPEGLEAAHIRPYRGLHTNENRNGILLRSDIHNLFDYGIVGVDPDRMRLVLNQRARRSKYSELHGRNLRIPEDPKNQPEKDLLERHLKLHGFTSIK